jgi:hypothetical protein
MPSIASTYRTYMNSSTVSAMPAIDSIARNKQTAGEVFGHNEALDSGGEEGTGYVEEDTKMVYEFGGANEPPRD